MNLDDLPTLDADALHAAVDLVGRSGARNFEVGYLHDDVPVEQAAWYAHAQYQGARLTAENHARPEAAAEALAVKVLSGAVCTHCRGLITLSDHGAVIHPGHLSDGSEMTAERARAMPRCRYRRHGDRWVRGCADTPSTPPRPAAGAASGTGPSPRAAPNRAQRRAAERRTRRRH